MNPKSSKITKTPSLNEAFEELENLVKEFETGEIDLESGIPKYKRGQELAKYLKQKLTEMENQITEIRDEPDSSTT